MSRTRRRFIETGVLASLVTVLAGCQGDSGDTDGGDGGSGDTDGGDGGSGDTDGGGSGETTDGGGGAGDGTTATTAMDGGSDGGGHEVTVDMAGSQFDPRNLEVEVGTRVVWANEDSFGHTVSSASDNWSFDEEVGGGGSTAFTFESSGVYDV
ncbi:MAG: plastocyanin/azurin family copper-binding protein, partial [Haloarculaceae archaeon]